ncbi:trigger factor [Rickettsiales endosymbiont of Peranema trichophorum]|uniref:trigger factor n=1 Tax=Rickettsiales endosymbiont of Peranema trichophorum TaxID=2486577 RepID=UPI001023D829|nr:trigger factor [Rickettsiales endosymbiont of Peranema trichophorum]RZI47320.1 trigger factor [Rickettsiales endosymbiont of Peranema trichophorum]
MKVETLESNGLSRKYHFSLPASSIMEKAEHQIAEEAKTFKMAGFRDGKVPLAMVKKRIGAQVLTSTIQEAANKALSEYLGKHNLKSVASPILEIQSFDETSRLIFEAKVELMPELPDIKWSDIKIEMLEVELDQSDIEKAHADIIKNFKNYTKTQAGYEAVTGDAIVIDFVGKVDDKDFNGNKGNDVRVELGSNTFIPGFEEQLVGAKSGDAKIVTVTFPSDYAVKELAGKVAIFDVNVKEVLNIQTATNIDDDFAKSLGVENLEKLDELIKMKISIDFQGVARLRAKRELFDIIDSKYSFDVPESMVNGDFEAMWREVKQQYESNPQAFKKTLEELESEYKGIARRRVKLGILVAELGKQNNIIVSVEDMQNAIRQELMQKPWYEKEILNFYSRQENIERLRGPILEEKVVDLIFTKIELVQKKLTSEEFMKVVGGEMSNAI